MTLTEKHMQDFPEDIQRIIDVALVFGKTHLTAEQACGLWECYSEDMCAGWLRLPETDEELWTIIKADLRLFGQELKETPTVNGDTSGCGGKRYNQGKLQWKLMPFDSLKGTVKVLEMGASKYGLGNWQKGMNWTTCWECLMRHAIAWRNGEDNDPESGESHLSHVICNALFLIFYGLNNRGKDDRKAGV